MKLYSRILPIAITTTVLATVSASMVFAQAQNLIRGRVTAVDASTKSVTINNRRTQQDVTFKVGDKTKIVQDAQGSISDLKVGDDVRVMGESTDDGVTISARMIMVPPTDKALQGGPGGPGGRRGGNGGPGGPGGAPGAGGPGGPGGPGGFGGGFGNFRFAMGKITALAPAITVETVDRDTKEKKTVTVKTDDNTKVTVVKPATFDDIKVDSNISAIGTPGSSVAQNVYIRAAMGRGGFGGGGRRQQQ